MTSRIIQLKTPLEEDDLKRLKTGERVLLSGEVYTARDAGHKRMVQLIRDGKALPFDAEGAVIYYVGPTPPHSGMVIGSCGPTTSSRMDAYLDAVLSAGIKATIGKGCRSSEAYEAMTRHGAVYLAAVGGTGAILSENVTGVEVVAWEDLGTEALRRLTVRDFPVIVACVPAGNDIFSEGRMKWSRE